MRTFVALIKNASVETPVGPMGGAKYGGLLVL
jgi:hypothetical protein